MPSPYDDPRLLAADLANSGDWTAPAATSGDAGDVSSLLASSGSGLPQQPAAPGGQSGGGGGFLSSLLSIPKAILSIPQAYASAYSDIPGQVAFNQRQRQFRNLQTQIGIQQAMRQYDILGRAFDLMGGAGSAQGGGQTAAPSGPDGSGALTGPSVGPPAGPAGAPGPAASPTSAAAPGPAQPPGLPQMGTVAYGASPQVRKALGLYALAKGEVPAALSAMTPKITVDRESGMVYDQDSGAVLGRMPRNKYESGWNVDPYAAGAPNYLPTLPQGIVPTAGGGVDTIKGYPQAVGSIEAGKTSAVAPFQKITVNVGGVPYDMNPQQWADYQRSGQLPGAPGGGAQGGAAPGTAPAAAGGPPGVPGISKAQETFDTAGATDAQGVLSKDMNARQGALQDRDSARGALAYVQANGKQMGPTLPYQVAGANYLRTLPPAVLQAAGIDPSKVDQMANDAASYNRLSSAGLLTFAKGNLPSRYTERELALGRPIIGTLATAPDAATYHWGLQQAMANKQLQRADFAAGYKGAPSRQAIEQAWNASPQGKASLYEDPGWQHLQIGGQPAVQFFPERNTQKQLTGRTVGVIGAGTGAPQTFYPSWSK